VSGIAARIAMFVAGAVALGAVLFGIYVLARRAWRWLVAIAVLLVIVGLVVLLELVLPLRYPNIDPALPLFFNYIWTWMLGFTLIALLAMGHAFRLVWIPAASSQIDDDSTTGHPDLQAALETIELRLAQAQIDLTKSKVFLMLAPDEEVAAAVIQSAGLQLFTQAPEIAAPIHAYASTDGILLSCSGASSFGTQLAQGDGGLEALCRALLARHPDCPLVRGVVVALPADWASQPESPKLAASVRDDLRTIQRILHLRLPVFVLLPQMEAVQGFTEFVRRMPDAMKQSRCGFAIPYTETFSSDLIQRALAWQSGWFHTWILSQMSEDLFNQTGNNLLYCLDHEVRRRRKGWRNVLDAAFSTHRDVEPLLFRGCYFLGTGRGPDEQAFSPGLFRGPRSRVIADRIMTAWSADAIAGDRRYRWLALGVGVAGGLLALFTWSYIVRQNPFWWIGFLGLIAVWLVLIIRWSWR
jgi:hypothetical protein